MLQSFTVFIILLLANLNFILAAPKPNEHTITLFARQAGQTCVPAQTTTAAVVAAQTKIMKAATAKAHTAENKCPSSSETTFNNSKDKAARTKMRTSCIKNWTE
jgi:hypothetical protein